ncbi:MAG: DUF4142 domain-containing protein [Pseudomonadota bacterium]
MPRKNVIKGILGLSGVAACFAVFTAQAQTTATDTGKPGATSQSTTGQATATQPSTGMQQSTGSGQPGATGSGSGTASLSKSDQKILMNMAQENMAEIEVARLAQSKSQNEQVKGFAQKMIDDHTKALDDVKQMAQAKNLTLPTELDRAHKGKVDKLASLSGEAFDRSYMAQAGVAEHKKVHGMLSKAQVKAKDPELKALASRMAPVVDQHLNSAQELHKNAARGSSKTQGNTGSSPEKR